MSRPFILEIYLETDKQTNWKTKISSRKKVWFKVTFYREQSSNWGCMRM